MKRWIKYSSLAIAALLVLLLIAGSAYERIGRHQAASKFPPPGKMVDIGGRKIQLDCRGSGSPTVVFEAGLDIGGSLSWSAVHDPVAQHTRACAYSRAGMMWSDPANGLMNAKRVAEDLHAALEKAGEHAPFVLVGHSLGGPYIMTYTKYFDTDVKGLVFVDASHPDQTQRLRTVMPEAENGLFKVAASLGWSGALRVAAPILLQQSPNQSAAEVAAIRSYASTSLPTLLEENEALEASLSEAGTFRDLGRRPLYVLTAMEPFSEASLASMKITSEQGNRVQAIWRELQEDEATWSSDSTHQVLVNSGHNIQFEKPEEVVAAVRSVVDKVRGSESVKP
ncbi:alpha/beta fold hydrolase [Burkholderia vietnamiensis]|uniref:alpha/beta fold hydrolase n=1 Tax=Burkholderia vietnamiensis TaxID=60552 RepID=UPI001D1433E0|nr:alpha/beta hydrolase [Burkholderia vietnamiensis]UEC01731.1 alpha/beta hydrolase [Burkholderia vietnamiensis]